MAGKNLMIYFGSEPITCWTSLRTASGSHPIPVFVVTALAEDYRVYALYVAAEPPTPPSRRHCVISGAAGSHRTAAQQRCCTDQQGGLPAGNPQYR